MSRSKSSIGCGEKTMAKRREGGIENEMHGRAEECLVRGEKE
jgi:hypothetical protein